MSKYNIMKAVEYDKLPVKFKKANPFDDLLAAGYWMQPKYDGCFGMAVINSPRSECKMLSRTGEDYSVSCAHILDALYEQGNREVVILGEVWHETDAFPKISGDFRRGQPSPHLLFVMHDILPMGLVTEQPYSARFDWLRRDTTPYGPLRLVARPFGTDAQALALRYKQMGNYDGVILRNPDAGYTIGTVKNGEIIKVKPVMSLDLQVTRVEVGEGKHAGRAGALVVLYKGVESSVGTGLTDSERVDWLAAYLSTGWEKTCPGAKTIVEIECMGITADGKLREPRFKGIRHDKLAPDV